jgi:hypothetical protein
MTVLELDTDEKKALLAILKRYYPDLQRERSNTDDQDYRKDLESQEKCMVKLINRLKEVSDS